MWWSVFKVKFKEVFTSSLMRCRKFVLCVCVRVQLNKQVFLWHIEFPFPVYATWQETNTEKDQLQEVSIFLDCTVNYFSCWSLWAPHPSTPLKEGKESKKLGVLHQISQCGYIRVIPKEKKGGEKFTKKELEIVFFCFFINWAILVLNVI